MLVRSAWLGEFNPGTQESEHSLLHGSNTRGYTQMSKGAPVIRYRCAYPGCTKRYSSTDGVRKHAKKAHHAWIKSIDALVERGGRQAVLEGAGLSKPSTYSIMERSSGAEPEKAVEPTPPTTTVKRLSSTGDVLSEQVAAEQVENVDGQGSDWPWVTPRELQAEDAFHGSDDGLSCVTLEAESHAIDPEHAEEAEDPSCFNPEELRASRMSSFHEVRPCVSLT